MWRCGSTYVWTCFRKNDDCYCFYEPLHHGLGKLTQDRITRNTGDTVAASKHPADAIFSFKEFSPLIKASGRGIKNYNPKFARNDFALNSQDKNNGIETYIRSLVKLAQNKDKTPVLGFNRTVYRVDWMRHHFDGYHIYIDRDPFDIWSSYWANKQANNYTFIIEWLLVVERNKNHPLLAPLATRLPLRCSFFDKLTKYKRYYRKATDLYMDEETSYYMTFYLWLAAVLSGLSYADLVYDISRVKEEGYNSGIEEQIEQDTKIVVSFDDAIPLRRDSSNAPFNKQSVEQEVLSIFPAGLFDRKTIEKKQSVLHAEKQKLLNF